jgi:beta-phosphoglucomutase
MNDVTDKTRGSPLLLLFDLDGTLVLTDDIYFIVWKNILQSYNLFLTKDIFHNCIFGKNDHTVISELLPLKIKEIDEITRLKDRLFIENIGSIRMVAGAYEFLQSLQTSGHKMAVVTNCNRATAEYILTYLHISHFFEIVVVGNECPRPKPYPDPYIETIRTLGGVAENTIIFEDSYSGLLSAKGTNPRCIVGLQTMYSKEELFNHFANIAISDYTTIGDTITLSDIFEYENTNDDLLKKRIIESIHLPIRTVRISPTKLKGGFIADVISAQLELNTGETVDCVIKLENHKSTFLTDMSKTLDLYGREYYFYDTISTHVPINIPRFYGIVRDETYRNLGIVMENLAPRFRLNLNLNDEPIRTSLNIIDSMVKLHTKYWNKPVRNCFRELKCNNDASVFPFWGDFVKSKWGEFKEKWANVLNASQMEKGDYIVGHFQEIQQKISEKNLTIIHGDIKSANIFYDVKGNGEEGAIPYFIDWQYVANGKGVQDLVFFMVESFTAEKIKDCKTLFKEYYYIKVVESGVVYPRDEFEEDFQNAAYFGPFTVAVWFGTLPTDDLIDKNFPLIFIQKLFRFYGE